MSGQKNGRKSDRCGRGSMTAREELAAEEYERLKQRAQADRIRKVLIGKLAPSREAVIKKLNRRRKCERIGLQNHRQRQSS
jgi:hypothetical protein